MPYIKGFFPGDGKYNPTFELDLPITLSARPIHRVRQLQRWICRVRR